MTRTFQNVVRKSLTVITDVCLADVLCLRPRLCSEIALFFIRDSRAILIRSAMEGLRLGGGGAASELATTASVSPVFDFAPASLTSLTGSALLILPFL